MNQSKAAAGATPGKGRPPGRNSLFWDVFSDLANLPLLLPVATMQSALPAVGTAVNRYGIYRTDPRGRGRRTNWSMLRFLWDGGDVARQEAHDLRALHANIKGTLDDGTKYFALNPKTFRIVPDTFLDAVIRVREDLGKPLTDAEKEKLYQEYIQLCLMFGIPEKDIEPTLKDFYVYYEDLILNTMTYNETVQHLTGRGIEVPWRLKKFTALQPWVDSLHRRYIYPTLKLTSIGALHPLYRQRFNLPWTAHDQARYEKLCRRLAKFARIVPRPLRYNPVALLVMLGIHGRDLVTMDELRAIEAGKETKAAAKKAAEKSAASEAKAG